MKSHIREEPRFQGSILMLGLKATTVFFQVYFSSSKGDFSMLDVDLCGNLLNFKELYPSNI